MRWVAIVFSGRRILEGKMVAMGRFVERRRRRFLRYNNCTRRIGCEQVGGEVASEALTLFGHNIPEGREMPMCGV